MRLVATILSAALCLSMGLSMGLCMASSQVVAQTADESASNQTETSTGTDEVADSKTADSKTADTEKSEPATKPPQPAKATVTSADTTNTDTTNKGEEKKNFELTFDDLKFEMEKGDKFDRSLLTEKINSYDNNTISVRGYIRPAFSQSGLKKFIFVRDNKECCFGPGAALYDCILVRLAKGNTTDFTVRPITIEGTFTLKEYMGPDGKVWSIYRMNGADVK